jgi:hypothetical protein
MTMTTQRTVRFWFDSATGNPCRIKMQSGQTLYHFWAAPTDEGWSSEAHQFHFDGERVFDNWNSDGRDCDGRLQSGGEHWFWAKDAAAGYGIGDLIYPAWQNGGDWQRDETAEAAGY